MELSMVDENMEAASDSHGFPGDEDIEIDLDIYQDHIDNDDEDVVVEDASATASDHPDISEDIHDVMSDADMVDKVDDEFLSGEVPDGEATSNKGESHGGGDGNGNGNGNGVVVTQPDQDTYTSTMEDDYDEDIDAPIPDDYIHEQPIDNEALSLEPNMPAEEGHSPPQDDHSQHIQSTKTEFDYAPQIAQQELDNDNYPPALRHGVGIQDYPEESYEEETASGNPQGTTGDDAAEFQLTRQPAEDGEAEIPSAEPHFSLQNANERHSAVAEEYQQETIGEAEEDVSFALEEKRRQATEESINEAANAAQSEDQKETEIKTGDHEAQYPLHRVTVLYQEDEMSLFPPHESDPSELYLLEDEELAYVPLRHLFQAFRGVLGNYVSEDNELVMLIDSLYVQLSEVSCY